MVRVNPAVRCVTLPAVGGTGMLDKIRIGFALPRIVLLAFKSALRADVVHTRGPSVPALVGVLLSFLIRGPSWWHKYAGNWNQEKPPLSYRIQRWLLKVASHTRVTINGRWSSQPSHCVTFANPCISDDERLAGQRTVSRKDVDGALTACFVGRLDDAKGCSRIIAAMSLPDFPFAEIIFVGEGELRPSYEQRAAMTGRKFRFVGSLDRESLNELYATCHAILLPSTASEGFPKVIAEAMNYGCVPIVSDVSAIPQYVNESNGFVWKRNGEASFGEWLSSMNVTQASLQQRARQAHEAVESFTFSSYLNAVQKLVTRTI